MYSNLTLTSTDYLHFYLKSYIEGSDTFLLFGGSYDEQSTEVFNVDNGVGESSFTLEYPSRGIVNWMMPFMK